MTEETDVLAPSSYSRFVVVTSRNAEMTNGLSSFLLAGDPLFDNYPAQMHLPAMLGDNWTITAVYPSSDCWLVQVAPPPP